MLLYRIQKNYPVPEVIEWTDILSKMEKGDSFRACVEDNLLHIYSEAKDLGIKITHETHSSYIRVWRVS